MKNTNINEDVIFALDIGTRSVIGTVGIVRDKKFYVMEEAYTEHKERAMIDGQIHDIDLVAYAVNIVKKNLENKLKIPLNNVSIAAAGRFLKTLTTTGELSIDYDKEIDKDLVRSLELTAVKKAENKINDEMDGKLYCVGYSVTNYYLNGYIISNLISHKGENISAKVIATFLPRSVVDSLYSVMKKVQLRVVSLTLEPIAAMEAAIPQNLRLLNLALVDIGAGTSDIAISSKDTISAYGMVSMAGDEITEIIAKNCLVDFSTAENIKKQCEINNKVKYIDVLGIENEITYSEIEKMIIPVVNKISNEISEKIIELNGGKAPNAVFLIGGGAHTPKLKECIAKSLGILDQKIAIKGRKTVTKCVCKDNSLGSMGVTVLGIALMSIKKLGHDFIDIILNGNIVSLFNSHRHTVMDVMLQGGINPKLLIGKNGKNIKFVLGGIKRVAFGTLATNAKILIDGREGNIDTEVKEGEEVTIDFAKDGEDSKPKLMDYINKLYSISFYINDIIHNMQPVALVNDEVTSIEDYIREGDNVEIIYPETLENFIKYYENCDKNQKDSKNNYYLNGQKLNINYKIKEGDRIYKINPSYLEETNEAQINEVQTNDIKQDSDNENSFKRINVVVNGDNVLLDNKKSYIYVDIFEYIQFNLTKVQGNLILKLNDKKASYNDGLKDGDVLEIRWEK